MLVLRPKAAKALVSAREFILSLFAIVGLINRIRPRRELVQERTGEDARLELAYDAVVKRLAQQDTTLSSARNRVTGLLSTAALITSFSATLGLLNTDPKKGSLLPRWVALTLLALLILIAVCAIAIHWPARNWSFGASAAKIMERVTAGDDVDSIRLYVVTELVAARNRNEKRISTRARWYQLAILALVVEVVVLVAGILVRGIFKRSGSAANGD